MAKCTTKNSRADCTVAKSSVRFEKDPLAERKLESWPGLIPELAERVKDAETVAIATAPVESGRYKSSITSDAGYDERAKIIGRLRADDWKAIWIEYGTSKTPAHATLRKAMESVGLLVRVKPRGRG